MDFPRWLQSRLTAHGFPCGAVDGEIGPITTAALKAFQRKKGLHQTGTATDETVKELRKSSTGTAPDMPGRDIEQLHSNIWPRQRDVPSFYGGVGTSQTKVEIPFDMYLAWDTSHRITRITLHKKVAASAERVFNRIAHEYSQKERQDLGIDLFGGSLNVRKMRGGSRYSMHSWGIAIDFDPARNQLKWNHTKARLAKPDAIPFWQAWEAEGWISLGRARDFDHMHVQAARL